VEFIHNASLTLMSAAAAECITDDDNVLIPIVFYICSFAHKFAENHQPNRRWLLLTHV